MVACFFSGYSGTSSGNAPGTHRLADSSFIRKAFRSGVLKRKWTDEEEQMAAIGVKNILKQGSAEPVMLLGHSLGGSAALGTAERLKALGIIVDLLIQIDSIGIGDETKPSNVHLGVNIWSTSRLGVNGASFVAGSINIPVNNTTHTDIDDDPSRNPNVGSVGSGFGDFTGKNAWELVRHFVYRLPKRGQNYRHWSPLRRALAPRNDANVKMPGTLVGV